MSRKINPISFRLGILQVWSSFFQNYGNSFQNYFQLLALKINVQYLFFYFYKYSKFYFLNTYLKINKSFIYFNFYCLNSVIDEKLILSLPYFLKVQFLLKFYILSYFELTNLHLLITYINFLISKNLNFLKIIRDLTLLFSFQISSKRTIMSCKGPLQLILTGFKIYLTGRFDHSRNQMSKCVSKQIGTLPLSSLHNYIEFKQFSANSKLGIIGFQIWIFYTIV